MSKAPWRADYANKLVSPEEALSHIRNGDTILIGSGAGEPVLLTDTLVEMAENFWDVHVIHLTARDGTGSQAAGPVREIPERTR